MYIWYNTYMSKRRMKFKITPQKIGHAIPKLIWWTMIGAMALSLVSTPVLILISLLSSNSAA